MSHDQQLTYRSECTKASYRHVEYYNKNPGHVRCPKCGSLMIPKREN